MSEGGRGREGEGWRDGWMDGGGGAATGSRSERGDEFCHAKD